jgi:predicted dehydrogenase
MHGHLVNVTPTLDDVRHYYKESYQAEINHFIECIQKNKRPMTSGKDALSLLKILDAMYESESTGAEVAFTS